MARTNKTALVRRSDTGDLYAHMITMDPKAARKIAKALGNTMDCAICSDGTRAQYDAMMCMFRALNDLADAAGVL